MLTDFGTSDAYVGSMKGVVLSHAPGATIVDISHEIPPQDVRRAAQVLAASARCFPPHTVHLVVVDPGVGTERKAVVVQDEQHSYVGPDNGVFADALHGTPDGAWEIAPTGSAVSPTFHGRDIFAPAAGRLAAGVPAEDLGPPVEELVAPEWPRPQRNGRLIEGEVAFVDHFGNAVTNVPIEMIADPKRASVEVAGRVIRTVRRTYGQVGRGTMLALTDSTGHLEVAVREGNAARRLKLRTGTPVLIREHA